jgi:ABC-type transporter Mla subunit MlaD
VETAATKCADLDDSLSAGFLSLTANDTTTVNNDVTADSAILDGPQPEAQETLDSLNLMVTEYNNQIYQLWLIYYDTLQQSDGCAPSITTSPTIPQVQ